MNTQIKDYIMSEVDDLLDGNTRIIIQEAKDTDANDLEVFLSYDKKKKINKFVYDIKLGAYTLCYYPVNCPFVIKMPITDTCYISDHYITENEARDGELLFAAIEKYEKASENLKKILLPTTYIGNYKNILPIFIQQKIDYCFEDIYTKTIICNYYNNFSNREGTIIKELGDIAKNTLIEPLFLYFCKLQYGVAKTLQFAKELRDAEFDDLHNGNVGFIKGSPIIFDYGGTDVGEYSKFFI